MSYLMRAVVVCMVAVGSVMAADAPETNLHLIMSTKVNPQGLALWEITNGALSDDGTFDAAKLSAAQWAALLPIGKSLEESGRILATSKQIIAAAPGEKLQDEGVAGASTAADVQRYIDAKPVVLRNHAMELQKTGAGVIEAAKKRDAKQLSDLSNSLDEVCEGCHVTFWYPQQQKL
ncbi:MAG: hypothetical protein AB7F79_10160 [Steroidobacteraceae bacterium]